MQLIQKFGKVMVRIHTPLKTSFHMELPEVETIGNLMNDIYLSEYLSPYYDKYSFWVYKVNSKTGHESTFDCQDVIGEVLNQLDEAEEYLLVKRRVYSPYYIINFRDYSTELINSLFY